MRSVAHDMGQQIGCGAHLASLRRTALAEFSLSDAHTLEELYAAAPSRPVATRYRICLSIRGCCCRGFRA